MGEQDTARDAMIEELEELQSELDRATASVARTTVSRALRSSIDSMAGRLLAELTHLIENAKADRNNQ